MATTTVTQSNSLPWKTRLALLLVSKVSDASRRRDGTVNRTLISILTHRSPPNRKPIDGVKTFDVTVDPSRKLWFRAFVPATTNDISSTPLPVVVFFHGGGFVYLNADSRAYDAVCRRFARTIPAILLSVDYRLAPESRYPAQYEDGYDVLKFLEENQKKSEISLPENADLSRCFLAGDSAGANIAHHLAKRVAQSDFQQLKVIGLVSIQPFFGGEERTEAEMKWTQLVTVERTDWMWKAFLPQGADRDHEAANVSGPRGEDISKLEKFPTTLVFVGGQDALQDWQRRYYRWLRNSGKEAYLIEYPSMVHAFYTFPELPESGQLISQVKDFIYNPSSPPSATPSSLLIPQ